MYAAVYGVLVPYDRQPLGADPDQQQPGYQHLQHCPDQGGGGGTDFFIKLILTISCEL